MTAVPDVVASVARATEDRLAGFLAEARPALAGIHPAVGGLFDSLAQFVLQGGKRIRPAFLYWAHVASGGQPGDALLDVACGLELLHAFALVHDDIMDGSDIRRGRPTVHREYEAGHRQRRADGDPTQHGVSAAILLGDLAFALADRAMFRAAFPPDVLLLALDVFTRLREEVLAGQYLDLVGIDAGVRDAAFAQHIARHKTGKYTVERPLHMGAVLARADDAVLATFSRYGIPLGEAFQLRDDVLGGFGDPAITGKPAGDDFREGKHTFLLAECRSNADSAQRARLEALVGCAGLDAAGVAEIREIVTATGALAATEARIDALLADSLSALESLDAPADAVAALETLACYAAHRER